HFFSNFFDPAASHRSSLIIILPFPTFVNTFFYIFSFFSIAILSANIFSSSTLMSPVSSDTTPFKKEMPPAA
ncbi:MAG TPA: hypothetical protein H9845_01460, partial [Candidatus Agathobaculum pullicola]|nr:hypothetical protein [Candidatus Agathobaculum pullicola]